MKRFRGVVWRHVPEEAVPQHLGWILTAVRGRWNTQRPRMPCIYTALTPEGAIAELDKHADQFAGRRRRRDLVSLLVDVDDILDLTSRIVRLRAGIDAARLVGDTPADLVYCRAIAREFVMGGPYGAIRAPSAASAGRQRRPPEPHDLHPPDASYPATGRRARPRHHHAGLPLAAAAVTDV